MGSRRGEARVEIGSKNLLFVIVIHQLRVDVRDRGN